MAGNKKAILKHLNPKLEKLEKEGIVQKRIIGEHKQVEWATAGDVNKISQYLTYPDPKGKPESIMIDGKEIFLSISLVSSLFIQLFEDRDDLNSKMDDLLAEKYNL